MRNTAHATGILIGVVSFALVSLTGPWQALTTLSFDQWRMLGIAVILVLISSILRAARTRAILNFGKTGSLVSHFQFLAAGSLVNAVFPFRLGEILRSLFLARKLRISFGFTLVAVAFERLIDVMLVMTLFLTAIWFLNSPLDAPYFLWNSIAALIFAGSTALILVMSIRQNKFVLRGLWKLTMFLNPHLSVRLKMSFWTLVHAFQRFTRDGRAISAYVALAFGSWILIILAVGIVYMTLKGPTSLAATLTPFIAPEFMFRLSGVDGLLVVMAKNLEFFEVVSAASTLEVVSITWLILNAPLGVIGFFVLINSRTYSRNSVSFLEEPRNTSRAKASELEEFLDSFFRRDELAEAVHGLTVDGSVTPIRFFKGGSNALTLLAEVEGEVVVRKIVSTGYQEKLRDQYAWLRKYGGLPYVAAPVREMAAGGCYMFDLEFVESQDMHSWLHKVPLSIAEARLRNLLTNLRRDVYKESTPPQKGVREEVVKLYLEDWIFGRLSYLEQTSPVLAEMINLPHIYINGDKHAGLRPLLDLIYKDPRSLGALADYSLTQGIHGDLTIDNMIIDRFGEIVLVDPDNNSIQSPVIDFSRLLQSLEGGYEFLNQLEEGEVQSRKEKHDQAWSIGFPIRRSVAYDSLALAVREIAKAELSAAEYSTLDLHAGLFFVRMLTHRLRISPETTPAYLATAVFFLERFLEKNEAI